MNQPPKEVEEKPVERIDEKTETKKKEEDSIEELPPITFEDTEEISTPNPSRLKELGFEVETIDDLPELFSEQVREAVDETIEGFLEDLDEEGAEFLRLKKNGGDTKKFFQSLSNISSLSTLDPTKETHWKTIVTEKYKQEGLDKEEVEERVEFLEESGKLENTAKRYHKEMLQKEEANKKAILEEAEEDNKNRMEAAKAVKEQLSSLIDKATDIGGLNISPTEKKDLKAFITKDSVRLKNGFTTGFQDALQKAFKDQDKLIALAYLLKNDLKFDKLKTQVKTEQTKQIKQGMSRVDSQRSTGQRKTLADFFN